MLTLLDSQRLLRAQRGKPSGGTGPLRKLFGSADHAQRRRAGRPLCRGTRSTRFIALLVPFRLLTCRVADRWLALAFRLGGLCRGRL